MSEERALCRKSREMVRGRSWIRGAEMASFTRPSCDCGSAWQGISLGCVMLIRVGTLRFVLELLAEARLSIVYFLIEREIGLV